jgi:dihydrolipoamide dehydrogenase
MYDVIIIGGGPGGYLAAERLGLRGRKTLLVEKQHLGGTCLNVGCIPTKTLLNSVKLYLHAKEAARFGVHAEVSFVWSEMTAWKDRTVQALRAGLASRMEHCKVETVAGTGIVETDGAERRVRVAETGGVYETRAVLVAAGSLPAMPPIPGAGNNPRVLDSTGLLSIETPPKKLCIIGGGVIGVEFACLFSGLGTEVSVVEMLEEIVPPMDKDHAVLMRRALPQIDFRLGCRVEAVEGAAVRFRTAGEKEESIDADTVLMAVGRRAETASWGAKEAGVDTGPKGVNVDDRMRTNIAGIWAAGDVNGRSMLAHSAYRMAEVAVDDICAFLDGGEGAGRNRMRYHAIPWAVYGIPEAAGAGLTEQEALARGRQILKASLPMTVSGRFAAENGFKAPGNVKVIADAGDGRILGVHMIGPYASEMIWGAAALIENEMRVADVKELVFPHPSVSDVLRDVLWNL